MAPFSVKMAASELKRERLAVVRRENAMLARGLQSAQGCHIRALSTTQAIYIGYSILEPSPRP